jgi:hypothetical protein
LLGLRPHLTHRYNLGNFIRFVYIFLSYLTITEANRFYQTPCYFFKYLYDMICVTTQTETVLFVFRIW